MARGRGGMRKVSWCGQVSLVAMSVCMFRFRRSQYSWEREGKGQRSTEQVMEGQKLEQSQKVLVL